MKTLTLLLLSLSLIGLSAKAQTFYSTFQVRTPETKTISPPANSSPTVNNYYQPSSNYNTIKPYEPEISVTEHRITGYYKEGSGNNVKLTPINLKINILSETQSREKIFVMAYKPTHSDSWTSVSYSNVSKVYDDMSSSFTYQVFINSMLVYFNL